MGFSCRRGGAFCGVCGAVILFYSCLPSIETPEQAVPRSQVFLATNLSGEGPKRYKVNANLIEEGKHCILYLDQNEKRASASQLARLVQEFDSRIYDSVTSAFGEPSLSKSKSEKRITILVMDIKDSASSAGGAYIAGYFYPNDLLHGADSNLIPMLYIDTDPGFSLMDNVFSTMAHELQHLISYSSRIWNGRKTLETWIDEGLSTGAESLYLRTQQQGRIRYFTADDSTIRDGNTFYIWGNRDDLLADYSSAYMFFQWLKIHASNGHSIYKDIIESDYSDYRAVTTAARLRLPAVVPPGLSNRESWARLLGTWLCANAINAPNGPYGYDGNIPELKVYSPQTASVLLAPGEAVYYAATETILENGENLRHIAISASEKTAFFDINPEDFDYYKNDGILSAIVTYNCNTDSKGANIVFNISSPLQSHVQPAELHAKTVKKDEGPAFYPVDARPFFDR